MSRKPRVNFSKFLAVFFTALFAFTTVAGIAAAFIGFDSSVLAYAIPATGTAATAAASFYYWKSKAENLSKQRIRYVLMKLLLKDQISAGAYTEVCFEIDNIDAILEAKLQGMAQEVVEESPEAQTPII